jgi:hypothetical protein
MLYKCANASCNAPFRRLREGKLFQVETEYFNGRGPSPAATKRIRPARRVEHYWLCDACSPFVTLTFDRGRGVITVPLPDGLGKKTVKMLSLDAATEMESVDGQREKSTLVEVMK